MPPPSDPVEEALKKVPTPRRIQLVAIEDDSTTPESSTMIINEPNDIEGKDIRQLQNAADEERRPRKRRSPTKTAQVVGITDAWSDMMRKALAIATTTDSSMGQVSFRCEG